MFSKTFSLITRHEIGYLATGFFWLLYSLLDFLEGDFFMLMKIVSMFAGIICMALTHMLKYEEDDEMSIKYINEARSVALHVTTTVIMLICLYNNAGPMLNRWFDLNITTDVPVVLWTWFIVGIAYCTTGALFIMFEKHSECLE